ncbi:hypothetical protein PtrSN002B_001535 [Pyrenophora tritici-repentis]|uniref:Atrophin-1 domain containing protein n=2 Tax=Pyrenophora tritici-repentis TaxID=45151 RepID=A0A2W1H7G9_9PLEO|nr:uncharacterized protein PTRG_10823 [Pyrenophora tritici-repentis Pt-1C-BFP]KAA8617985.1 hypothetical protein PtrV1_09492 [Pyrenophora tritici-repentis]EDU43873.1 conserved hypothetical protein [Pyrenophora tritici-repentis Pt-1C-BFP]KAF7443055.1 hypothetical protein A1F99_125620 [Pyrenophora tritici-repentis]KAF7568477.1 Atrophin-1 domain containing protein [Pyrenophora tritici-repentis]KAG9376567.1 hypothetical protein A1F94_013114 [Pyrenophora tritici-repentis]
MKPASVLIPLLTTSTTLAARTLPPSWSFTITSLLGPGCPDTDKTPSPGGTVTRPTFGSNTVDGTEIYYWFIAYPWMRVDLQQGPRHTWCEATLAYKEYSDAGNTVEGEAYRLRLHKNGTRGLATYELEEGVMSYWDFAYYEGEGRGKKEIADTITLNGPTQSGQYAQPLYSNISYPPEFIPQSKCGSSTFTFRTEMFVQGEAGKKGVLDSEKTTSEELGVQYYGAQQGFSYDWEKC